MNASCFLDEEWRDCLQEVANIAMGQAADRLARVLDAFVILPIPHVEVCRPSDISMTLQSLGDSKTVSGVCQGFIGGGIAGEALLIFNDASFSNLAKLLKYEGEINQQIEHELEVDSANILIGACIRGIAEQIDVDFSFGAPVLLSQHCKITELVKPETLQWDQALVIEINYAIEDHQVNCDLLLVFTENSIQCLKKKLAYLFED